MKILITAVTAAGMLTLLLMLFASSANAALDDAKAQELMKKAGCAVCHSVDKKMVGPAYKDVAQKRKGEQDAIATMENSVRNGSKGTYGQIPMPPNPVGKIGNPELRELVEWVLTK